MFDLFLASENIPFSVAIAVMLLIGLLELAASLFGMGASSFFDSLMPDLDGLPDGGHLDLEGGLSRFLGWLRVGRVPVLILFVIFLANFGMAGLFLQNLLFSFSGRYIPAILAALGVLPLGLFLTRFWGGLLEKVFPRDETSAVSCESLIGRVAVITLGTAKSGSPAEAKASDAHGQTHYFLVEPDQEEDVFSSGDLVLLVSLNGHVYRAILNPSTHLSDSPT